MKIIQNQHIIYAVVKDLKFIKIRNKLRGNLFVDIQQRKILKEMYNSGDLTQEEYTKAKKKVLE